MPSTSPHIVFLLFLGCKINILCVVPPPIEFEISLFFQHVFIEDIASQTFWARQNQLVTLGSKMLLYASQNACSEHFETRVQNLVS